MGTNSRYPDSTVDDPVRDGAEFEDFVTLTLQPHGMYLQTFKSKKYQFERGESVQGWEIKLDSRCSETGRLSIEIAEKTLGDPSRPWTPSGIYRNDNTWLYIQGNYNGVFIFLKSFLVGLHGSGKYEESEHPHGGAATIRKFYLPLEDARKYGHWIEGVKSVEDGL